MAPYANANNEIYNTSYQLPTSTASEIGTGRVLLCIFGVGDISQPEKPP